MTPAPGSQPTGIEREIRPKDVVAPWAQVTFGPPGPWVEEEAFEEAVVAKEGAHTTYLLWARQVDAEAGKAFFATAVRLETAVAVQNESQWRLVLDPRYQQVTLHWLRVVRNHERINNLSRDRMRLIQRETQLERHIVSGSWTLLVVLDDVRPGDIIEAAYTYASRHPISFGWCEALYWVPAQFVVGRYRLSVLFDSARPGMACKTSSDAPSRQETSSLGGRTRWVWEGVQLIPRPAEGNQPSTYLGYIWVQVSDIESWSQLAKRVAEKWAGADDGTNLDEFPGLLRPQGPDTAAVKGLVRHLQDNFRYLSIDLNMGGWIPAAPGVVARRRYGDCKDLAWLASAVLRRWGLKARPILVGTVWRERVASFLPTTLQFNHAVLEVEVAGAVRWFDLTLRSQGGDFTSQPINWYECGLPVDESAQALQVQPGSRAPNLYALHDRIYLDTRLGEPSVVESRIWAEGFQAENLRRAWLAHGPEKYADERLKLVQRRFGKAVRIGALQWRDDREKNVCELADAYEIRDAVLAAEGGRAVYDIPANMITQAIGVPEDKPRQGPWAMPFPLEYRHRTSIRCRGLGSGKLERRKWEGTGFVATLDQRHLRGEWERRARFIVTAAEIGADQVAEYRRQLMDFYKAASWRLFLQRGFPRTVPETGLGVLPPVEDGLATCVPVEDPAIYPKATIGEPNPFITRRTWLGNFVRTRNGRVSLWIGWFCIVIAFALLKGCNQPQ